MATAADILHGHNRVQQLLGQEHGHNASITDDVLRIAAVDSGCGDRSMRTILHQRVDEWRNIPIIHDVLRIAAANSGCGDRIVGSILSR